MARLTEAVTEKVVSVSPANGPVNGNSGERSLHCAGRGLALDDDGVASECRHHETNLRLERALRDVREQMASLQEEVDKLCAPPSTYGVYLSANDDGTVTVLSQGRKVKVNLHPAITTETLKPGQELILNEGLNVIAVGSYEIQGEVVVLKEQLDDERALV